MELKSRMPGKIEEVKVKVGDEVKAGDVLVVMEALKMKTPLPASQAGKVTAVKVAVGDRVNAGAILVVVE